MKLRRRPEDFQVEELADFPVAEEGPFAVYSLHKQGLGTLEAVEAIQQRWAIERRRISWGGLKDRHAVTTQWITIHRGPKRDLQQSHLELTYLGQSTRPFTPQEIRGNRFVIVLRSLNADALQRAKQAVLELQEDGLPNYFDDQRFGSVTVDGEFIARPWIEGNYERTLWLALAAPQPSDRPQERQQKQLLREHWGDWSACKERLDRSHRRSIITFLADRPGDFRGAWTRVRVDLRSLYLAAFQSHLWNRMLAALLRERCPPDCLRDVAVRLGAAPYFGRLSPALRAELQGLSLPLPSARLKPEPGPIRDLLDRVLAEEGLELRQIRVKHPRDSFFSKGWRKAVVRADGLAGSEGADEFELGRWRLELAFTLPRGSYATVLVKRISAAAGPVEATPDDPDDDITLEAPEGDLEGSGGGGLTD